MKLIDYPTFVPPQRYQNAMDRMVQKLSQESSVRSVYQIGSTRTPGISDIDLRVVFKDGESCNVNPLNDLTDVDRYLFTHALFGIPEFKLSALTEFEYFHAYRHLWGSEFSNLNTCTDTSVTRAANIQASLEYLIKMYISITLESTYNIAKVRGLLLHINALFIDLKYLGIQEGALHSSLTEISRWRESWFKSPPPDAKLKRWIYEFPGILGSTLTHLLKDHDFYLPSWSSRAVARNIKLVPRSKFGYRHWGVRMPAFLGGIGRRYFNLNNRLNYFEFHVPCETVPTVDDLERRARQIRNLNAYNKAMLPHFSSVAYAMNIFQSASVSPSDESQK